MNRRSFIQSTLALAGIASVLPSLLSAEERRRGGGAAAGGAAAGAVLVDPKDPAAKAVNYVHNNKEIKDAALKTERSGVKFEKQQCTGCTFYALDKESVVAGKKSAPCQMPFAAGKNVSATGWCSSWAKRG